MAKKKQVVINTEELVPTTLATVQDKKKASIFGIIWLFIIFMIFIIGVIYLPDISSYVNSYLNPEVNDNTINEDATEEEETEEKEKPEEYTISDELVISLEKFSLNNFSIENNSIKFNINNISSEVLELKDMHYFIELYNDNKKLLQRIYLTDIISPSSSTELSFNISETPTIISIVQITEEEYPNHIVTVPEEGVATLVCTKDNEKIEYSLNSNKVYVISISYEVSILDQNFNSLLSSYQLQKTTYDAIEGVSSNLVTENNILKFKTIINLSSVKENALNLKVVYPYKTDAKVIYFEMTASGYTCN